MSTPINDGGPAFPHIIPEGNGCAPYIHNGMTLRDWFAGQALAGILGTHTEANTAGAKVFAECAYVVADAMLKAREGKQ